MKFGKRDLWILECVRQAFFAARIRDVILASDAAKWITVHPNGKGMTNSGENAKGTPVLLDEETGEVLGGMGGKFTGMHISEACSTEPTENSQHIIRRGQEKRKNPEAFEAEQQRKMDEAEAAAAKAQEKAAAQAEAEKKKAEEAKAKAAKEAEEAKKKTEAQVSGSVQNHFSSLNSSSSVEEVAAALEKQSQVVHDTATPKGRHAERKFRYEAITQALALDPVQAAAAYSAHIKKVGPPDFEAIKDHAEAEAYLKKLLPNAYFRMSPKVNPEIRAQAVKGIYTFVSAFPGVANYMTGLNDFNQIKKTESELKRAQTKEEQDGISKAGWPEAAKAELEEARRGEQAYAQQLRKKWDVNSTLYNQTQEAVKRFAQNTYHKKRTRIAENGAISLITGFGLSRPDAEKIITDLKTRTGGTAKLDDIAMQQLVEGYKNMVIKIKCENRMKIIETDVAKKYNLPDPSSIKPDTKTTWEYFEGYHWKNRKDPGNGYCAPIYPPPEATGSPSTITIDYGLTGEDYSRSPDEIKLSIDRAVQRGFRPKRRPDVLPAEATMVHEMGHALDAALNNNPEEAWFSSGSKEINDLYNAEKGKAEIIPEYGLRPYWTDDPVELVAETMLAKLCGDEEAMTPLFQKVYDIVEKAYKDKFGGNNVL